MGLVLFILTTAAYAQYENGSLVGTIHDSTGAAIAGATVSVMNDATGITSTSAANATGDYEFPSLRVGTYTVRAQAPGFSIALAQHISIAVGSRERINL